MAGEYVCAEYVYAEAAESVPIPAKRICWLFRPNTASIGPAVVETAASVLPPLIASFSSWLVKLTVTS